MRTEHLQNVHLGWVAAGWLIAAAVTSLVIIVLAGVGALQSAAAGTAWSVVAVVIGFYVGGMFTGFRSIDAPILHGVAIGIFSLVAWFVINVIVSFGFPHAGWAALTPTNAAGLLLLQLVTAVGGAWSGHLIAVHGGPDVTD